MDYNVLFFFLIQTTAQATSLHHCNSGVYSSTSGMGDDQQLTTLQYCLIDNCTIMRIDTGQQLDIVYTTQSHLVITPTDGQTFILISKNDPELFCSTIDTTNSSTIAFQIVGLVIAAIPAFVSGYTALVHMMFKELRTEFGKLMMFYNLAIFLGFFPLLAMSVTHFNIMVHSVMLCYVFNFSFIELALFSEPISTCVIAYLAYVMRQSYKCREVTEEANKQFYKYAITFVFGLSLLLGLFVVSYDFGTGTYKHTLMPNNHCSILHVGSEYDTVRLLDAYAFINEVIQMFLLVVYFIYYYKHNKLLKIVQIPEMADTDTKWDQFFLKIAIMMGAALGLSHMLFAFAWYFNNLLYMYVAIILFAVQQCIIMSLFLCSKKVSQLYKKRCCAATTETSP